MENPRGVATGPLADAYRAAMEGNSGAAIRPTPLVNKQPDLEVANVEIETRKRVHEVSSEEAE